MLSSPAERIEIVWGKLLTVMLFSMATAVLNLVSMGITGSFVLSQLPDLGPPPLLAIVWLLVALVPVSALFSALCLALAAFARSTKEGQYYLMPLVLVTMPLMILPMAPGVELNLGNSLIPITGVVLLLRAMLEGNYLAALPYIPLVVGGDARLLLAGDSLGHRSIQLPRACCFAKASGGTSGCGSSTCCAIAKTRPALPKPCFAAC